MEEHTPQLFEEENASEAETHQMTQLMIVQISYLRKDLNEEEDFEIPAFLRKQKF